MIGSGFIFEYDNNHKRVDRATEIGTLPLSPEPGLHH